MARDYAVRFWSKGCVDRTRVVSARGRGEAIRRVLRKRFIHFTVYDMIDAVAL